VFGYVIIRYRSNIAKTAGIKINRIASWMGAVLTRSANGSARPTRTLVHIGRAARLSTNVIGRWYAGNPSQMLRMRESRRVEDETWGRKRNERSDTTPS
jgi:hypothetical protein